jgi:hypothetical protein
MLKNHFQIRWKKSPKLRTLVSYSIFIIKENHMKNNKNTKTVSMKIIITEAQVDRLMSNIKNAEKFKVKK